MLFKKGFPQAIFNTVGAFEERFSNTVLAVKKVNPITWLLLLSPVLLAIVIWLPRWQAEEAIKDPKNKDSLFELENKARTTLISSLTLLGGSSIVATFLAFRQLQDAEVNRRNAQIQEMNVAILRATEAEKQLTERFTKAAEMLGTDKVEVRIAGIYALENVAKESDKDYWAVMEVLSSFIRVRSSSLSYADGAKPENLEQPGQDVLAALTVILRRDNTKDVYSRRLDLGGANLNRVRFASGANLSRVDFRGAKLRNVDLAHIDLSGADLAKADLSDANLIAVNLSCADLSQADFSRADLSRACIKDARIGNAKLKDAALSLVDLSGADLSNANLENAYLSNANLENAYLKGADLSRATLPNATLENGVLSEVNLNRANLRGAILIGAKLDGANLMGANLMGANLSGTALIKANLSGAALSDADLIRADLSEADLRGVNLSWADLSRANLEGVHFSGANLRKAWKLTPEQVREAKKWEEAIYDLDFAEQLGLDKDEQIRRAKEWDEKHQGDRTHFSSLWQAHEFQWEHNTPTDQGNNKDH